MTFDKIIKPDQYILSVTRTIPVEDISKVIGPTFMELVSYIQQETAEIVSMPFVCYKNMDEKGNVDEKSVEMEVGFPINKLIKERDRVKSYFLPTHKAVSTLFTGKYEDVTPIYLAGLAYIDEIGGEFLGKSYEYYLSDYLSDEEIPKEKQETLIEIPYVL